MSDPTRELDALVAAARRERGPDGARRRIWAAVASASPAPVAPAAPVGALGGRLLVFVVATVVAAGTSIGTLVAIAPAWSSDGDRRSPIAMPSVASPVSVVADAPPPVEVRRASPARPSPANVARPRRASVPAQQRVRDDAPVDATEVTPAGLLDDVQLLARAWQAIRDDRADQALALVETHAARFPASALAVERRACELVAKCVRGDAGARDEAAAHLGRDPAGVHAKRVRVACGLANP